MEGETLDGGEGGGGASWQGRAGRARQVAGKRVETVVESTTS